MAACDTLRYHGLLSAHLVHFLGTAIHIFIWSVAIGGRRDVRPYVTLVALETDLLMLGVRRMSRMSPNMLREQNG